MQYYYYSLFSQFLGQLLPSCFAPCSSHPHHMALSVGQPLVQRCKIAVVSLLRSSQLVKRDVETAVFRAGPGSLLLPRSCARLLFVNSYSLPTSEFIRFSRTRMPFTFPTE